MSPEKRQKKRKEYRQEMKQWRRDKKQAKKQNARRDAAQGRAQAFEAGTSRTQTGIGFNPELENLLSSYQAEGDRTVAYAQEGRENLQREFFDPTDPFSRQAMAERLANRSRAQQDISASSQGKLYSGANLAQKRDLETDILGDRHALLQEFSARNTDLNRSEADTLAGLAGQTAEATYGAARDRAYDIEATEAPNFWEMGRTATGGVYKKGKVGKRPKKPKFGKKKGGRRG